MRNLAIGIIIMSLSGQVAEASNCRNTAKDIFFKESTQKTFNVPGLKVASVSDESKSTGATVFYFPTGAYAHFDARGGSVGASETNLLEEGSYSNQIDAIVFAGGSTMGLSAGDGVRQEIFKARAGSNDFDFIPSVPTAVVFDFGARIAPNAKPFVFPDQNMGKKLMSQLSDKVFNEGRAGAGTGTTCKKVCDPRWGGQGMATAEIRSPEFGSAKLFAAVVLNPGGDIIKKGDSFAVKFPSIAEQVGWKNSLEIPDHEGQNTTLSIVVTDLPLDRSQLKRIAVMAHTSMARSIYPFHTPTDGDILFVVSTGGNTATPGDMIERGIGEKAAELLQQAIESAVTAANHSYE